MCDTIKKQQDFILTLLSRLSTHNVHKRKRRNV